MEGRTVVDPGTVASCVAAAAGACAGWQLRRRARRAEDEVATLRDELRAERHAAAHDPLTGLPNRRGFHQLGAELLADPTRPALVAILLDLDDFKRVNDTLGHAAGDQVLVALGRRFAACAGDGLVGRLGGDEFAALLGWPVDERWLLAAGCRLTEALAAPVQVAGRSVTVTASLGIAPVLGPATLDEVLERADAAMYRAKTVPGLAVCVGWHRDGDGTWPVAMARARAGTGSGRPTRASVDAAAG